MTGNRIARRAALAFAIGLAGCDDGRRGPGGSLDARARELAQAFLIVDGHIDVPYRLGIEWEDVGLATANGQFDFPRARAGGLDAPFFSIFTPAEKEEAGEAFAFGEAQIDLVEAIVRAHPDKFAIATSSAEVRALHEEGTRVALLLGMENGAPIAGDLANVDHFAARGIRYVTLCHGKDNHICDSSYDDRRTWGGLSPFGREVVARLNERGVLIDVSHVSDASAHQVLDLSKAPVIASHSSARRYTPGWERNLPDDLIRRIAEQGGVVMINFGSDFVDEAFRVAHEVEWKEVAVWAKEQGVSEDGPEARAHVRALRETRPLPFPDVAKVADHVLHVIAIAGVDHVGFGSDYDGVGDTLPRGLEDVSCYPNLIRELLARGLDEAQVEKICGLNLLRVLADTEQVAAELSSR